MIDFLFPKRTRIIILIDMLLLIELTGSIFWATRFPDVVTAVFIKTYVPVVLLTMVGGKIWLKKFPPADEVTEKLKGLENEKR